MVFSEWAEATRLNAWPPLPHLLRYQSRPVFPPLDQPELGMVSPNSLSPELSRYGVPGTPGSTCYHIPAWIW